jgi:hypothetical protein
MERRRLETRLSWSRLILFGVGAALVWPTLFSKALAAAWLLLPLALFIAVVIAHDRTIRARIRAERAVAYYQRALARLEDRWAGVGPDGRDFLSAQHPYAADLDLFGRGSLFQLLSMARTRTGERTLAGWLCEPATPAEIRRRQLAVDELRQHLDFREELALLGRDVYDGVDPQDLISWSAVAPKLIARWPVWCALPLGVLNLVAATHWLSSQFVLAEAGATVSLVDGGLPLLITLMVSGVLALLFRDRVRSVLKAVDRPERELQLLAKVLELIEKQRFESPLLVELRAVLDTAGDPPSRWITRLVRLVQIDESRRNMLFLPLAGLLLLGTQLGFALERWRGATGGAVERWLTAVGAIEALVALARYAYEHPEDPFPEIVDAGACIEGSGLGHPLLPAAETVRNDLRLGAEVQVLLISGSNMSGKSTLLRTVGVNAVLAFAGAPVRARALRISPLAIGACMRITDSLQQGLSHFYAEIKRLKQIVDLGQGSLPLLFLLDEILHGTNSHDRRIGAGALIHGLVNDRNLGLVTTHDLALSRIADELAPRASNVHFVDHLEGDRIVFDYVLQQGVVTRSNALQLMRAIGLDV